MGVPVTVTGTRASGNDRGNSSMSDHPWILPPPTTTPSSARGGWRRAFFVVNAARRFRNYEDYLHTRHSKGFITPHAIEHLQQRITALITKSKSKSVELQPFSKSEGFGISPAELIDLHQSKDPDNLESLGGLGELASALEVNMDKGIDDEDEESLNRRIKVFGTNTYPEKPLKNFFVFLREACDDIILKILTICAIASVAAGIATEGAEEGWFDGAGIAFAVIVVVLVTAFNDYRQALQFRTLDAEKRNIKVSTFRCQTRKDVSIYGLLVGDIVYLNEGDQVPADGIVISSSSMACDQSSMTGESDIIKKDSVHDPFLISGTKVAEGFGTMMVVNVGLNTEWGRMMAIMSEEDEKATPLQERLDRLAVTIGKIGLAVASLTLYVLLVRFLTDYDYDGSFEGEDIEVLIEDVALAVAILVVAIPEGLPLAVTVSLAYSMGKMMNDKALVRHLKACEIMGGATAICSDKTGTLTTNKMTVVRSYIGGNTFDDSSDKSSVASSTLDVLREGICVNTAGSIYINKDGEVEVTGKPTEAAVLSFGLTIDVDYDAQRSAVEIIRTEPFSSKRKRMGILIRKDKTGTSDLRVHWKGASEIILSQCTHYLDEDGSEKKISSEFREEMTNMISEFATMSLRTLILAYRDYPNTDYDQLSNTQNAIPESDLVMIAMVGIKDPCRPGVPDAVKRCQKAGIVVRMVTGDHLLTAKAIASECNILTKEDHVCIEGSVFSSMSEEEKLKLIPNLRVMARSSPTDKYELVKLLRSKGEVVAVTGDGSNDAPALKEADIGLSMGIAGTEFAKEASDIVILDDNFTSIVKVVRWGRSVYTNIQKFVQFQLTVNIAALVLNFFIAAIDGVAPLNPVQLLWVNLIMDTLGALALGTEAPTDELMEIRPYGRRDPLISNIMWRNMIGQAVFQLIVLFIFYFAGYELFNIERPPASIETRDLDENTEFRTLNTIIFNTFVYAQIFNEVNSRHMQKINVFKGLLRNWLFVGIVLVEAGLQIVMTELAGDFARTEPLITRENIGRWGISIGVAAITIPWGAALKLIPVPKEPIFGYASEDHQTYDDDDKEEESPEQFSEKAAKK